MIFSESLQRKKIHVQVHFTVASQFYVHLNVKFYNTLSYILRSHKCGNIYTRFHTFYVHINVELYIHAFIHLYGGEKTGMLIFFLVLVVRDIGADYTSQS